MESNVSRRKFIGLSAVGIMTTISGCGNRGKTISPKDPSYKAGIEFRTNEPIMENSHLSAPESTNLSDIALITDTDQDRIRWEYLKEEISQFIKDFHPPRYDEGYFYTVVQYKCCEGYTLNKINDSHIDKTLKIDYELTSEEEGIGSGDLLHSLTLWKAESYTPKELSVDIIYEGTFSQ